MIFLRNNQMRLHRSLLHVLDTLLRTKPTANALQIGLHQRVHDADRAMTPGEERSSPYSRLCQRNFYVQKGVRPR